MRLCNTCIESASSGLLCWRRQRIKSVQDCEDETELQPAAVQVPWADLRHACLAAQEAAMSDWREGPTEYGGLFAWHQDNASILLQKSDQAKEHVDNFCGLIGHGLVQHGCCSGLGSASIALKQQLGALARVADCVQGWAGVMTVAYSPGVSRQLC